MKRPLRESDIEQYLVAQVKAIGGECRKVKWIGRSGAPDRLLMLPWPNTTSGIGEIEDIPARTVWVELKAPGVPAKPHQLREHARMRKMGQRVEVIDSYEQIEELLK